MCILHETSEVVNDILEKLPDTPIVNTIHTILQSFENNTEQYDADNIKK